MCPPAEPHNRIKDYLPPAAPESPAPVPPQGEEAYPWLGFWPRLIAFFRQRCPRCCRGKIFGGFFRMNDPCPVCGMVFQREEGYFLGAMYVSYLIGTVLAGLFYWAVWTWNPEMGGAACGIIDGRTPGMIDALRPSGNALGSTTLSNAWLMIALSVELTP